MANLNGKKGSALHQKVQEAEFEKLKQEYDNNKKIMVDTEVPVFTPHGKKKQRVADVAAFGTEKPFPFVKVVQVGKTDEDGNPVKREQEAIEDIEKHTEIKVKFVNYEDYETNANE
ncbi:MAG: hypothetical protein EAZ97_11200 [Bacteroidetes bacterium]|nr:MAG: hypothetical protein EAZ97_11200 [Bacteroidota bacterium]